MLRSLLAVASKTIIERKKKKKKTRRSSYMIAFAITQIATALRTAVWVEMYRIESYKTGDFPNP